jgi:hypothetical protein
VTAEKKGTVARIADILEDVADLFGIGSRVVRNASDLVSKDGRQQVKDEIAERSRRPADPPTK